MAIKNKFIHFNTRAGFDTKMPNPTDITHDFYNYTVFIKDTKEIYTHGQFYNCSGVNEELLETLNTLMAEVEENEEVAARALSELNENKASRGEIPTKVSQLTNDSNYISGRELATAVNYKQDKLVSGINIKTVEGKSLIGEGNISVCVQSDWNVSDANSKAYIKNKPVIPSAITETTISGWGFTKNTGTYSKPSGGIPKSDLASAVQTSLGKADTALQSHQDISGKQDKLVSGTNIKTINGQSILGSGNITIDSVDETTINDWGFTKNTGTYIKPNSGIPKTDLDDKVQESLNKADTALQSYTEQYTGTVTSIVVNGFTKTPTKGIVNLGDVTTYVPMTLNTADTAPVEFRWSPNQKYAYTSPATGSVLFNLDVSEIITTKDNTWCVTFCTGTVAPTVNFGIGSTGYTIMWANGVSPIFEPNAVYEITFKLINRTFLGVCGVFKTI